jgi:Ca2+-binding EF-hand superfamily protein
MDFNSFCRMFDVCQTAFSRIEKNRQIKSLADVDVETKKNFLILLATIIKNEKKIDCIKAKLQKAKEMNLRDVFACFDSDEDGYLSITDFRVVWKKYFNL